MLRVNLIKNSIRWLSTETKLLKGTLTLRFHEYLTQNQGIGNQQQSIIIDHVEKIAEQAKNKYEKVKLMDKSYMNSLRNQMKQEEMIECLDYLVKSYPNQIINLKFFDEALKILLENDEICQKYFTKLCFLIGFYKKFHPGPRYLEKLLLNYLDAKIGELNRMDFAILCISSYKTSVRIQNKNFHERLINEILVTNDNDTFLLVAFIKSLKHNQVMSHEIVEKIAELNHVYDFDYASLVHIFPYIADNSIKNDNLIKAICEKCIKTFDENVRAKDIQKFLHSCALLNLKMERKDLEKLESIIIARTVHEEFKTHFDHFVNAALSLWILNHHSKKLIEKLFEDERFHKSGPQARIKLDSRMKLLETCVEIERPKWIKKTKSISFKEDRPSPGYLIKSSLEKAMNSTLNGRNGNFVQQIKNINIAGILVPEGNEKIHYEILDEFTSLSDKKTPTGIFQLKLRLLRKLNCNVKVISSF